MGIFPSKKGRAIRVAQLGPDRLSTSSCSGPLAPSSPLCAGRGSAMGAWLKPTMGQPAAGVGWERAADSPVALAWQ